MLIHLWRNSIYIFNLIGLKNMFAFMKWIKFQFDEIVNENSNNFRIRHKRAGVAEEFPPESEVLYDIWQKLEWMGNGNNVLVVNTITVLLITGVLPISHETWMCDKFHSILYLIDVRKSTKHDIPSIRVTNRTFFQLHSIPLRWVGSKVSWLYDYSSSSLLTK